MGGNDTGIHGITARHFGRTKRRSLRYATCGACRCGTPVNLDGELPGGFGYLEWNGTLSALGKE
jgi:hypothetical protein